MPGYVRTDEEIRNIQEFLKTSRFTAEDVLVEFKTEWDFAREMLPPIFEPTGDREAGTADAFVSIGQWESAYCGPMDCALIGISCTYEGQDGFWLLSEIISNELPVTIGRELWGEIKKTGTARLYRDDKHFWGVAERRGHTIFEIDADIDGEELGPLTVEGASFDIKMFPRSDAQGLEYDPRLNIWAVTNEYTSRRQGTATITWGNSPWDPAWTVPIVSTGVATYQNYVNYYPLGRQVPLQDPDNIYPRYLWGRGYDDPTHYPIAHRFRGQSKLNQPAL